MYDSILITKLREGIDVACDFAIKNFGLDIGGIAGEIISLKPDGECDFSCMSIMSGLIGEARRQEGYFNFLYHETIDSHRRMLNKDKPLTVGWASAPYVHTYCTLTDKESGEKYSIMICSVGGTKEQGKELNSIVARALV